MAGAPASPWPEWLAGLRSAHLRLRCFERRDYEGIRSWVNNPEVTRGLVDADIFAHEHQAAETMAFLESSLAIDPANIRLVVAGRAQDEYLGQIALFDFDDGAQACQIDIVLADPRRYDLGMGTEAVSLATKLAFGPLGRVSVTARIVATNRRAARCFEKAGFHPEGRRPPGQAILEVRMRRPASSPA